MIETNVTSSRQVSSQANRSVTRPGGQSELAMVPCARMIFPQEEGPPLPNTNEKNQMVGDRQVSSQSP